MKTKHSASIVGFSMLMQQIANLCFKKGGKYRLSEGVFSHVTDSYYEEYLHSRQLFA
jgi:hypothetical protein